jgi:hypothetical protein
MTPGTDGGTAAPVQAFKDPVIVQRRIGVIGVPTGGIGGACGQPTTTFLSSYDWPVRVSLLGTTACGPDNEHWTVAA